MSTEAARGSCCVHSIFCLQPIFHYIYIHFSVRMSHCLSQHTDERMQTQRTGHTTYNVHTSIYAFAYAYFSICTRDIRVGPDQRVRVALRKHKHNTRSTQTHVRANGTHEQLDKRPKPTKSKSKSRRMRMKKRPETRTKKTCVYRGNFDLEKYNKWTLNYPKYMKNICSSSSSARTKYNSVRELKHHRRQSRCSREMLQICAQRSV